MDQQTKDLITQEIENNDVCLFMKGTPEAPQCGFSYKVVDILKAWKIPYKSFNVIKPLFFFMSA